MTVYNTTKTSMKKKLPLQVGSTLVELLIAMMIVGTIVTAVAAGVTSSVKNNAESRYREVATNLGQQVVEILRKERSQLGWANFYGDLSTTEYCVPTGADAVTDFLEESVCTVTEANTDFTRTLTITKVGGNEVIAVVVVSWLRSPGNPSQITLTQEFKDISRN